MQVSDERAALSVSAYHNGINPTNPGQYISWLGTNCAGCQNTMAAYDFRVGIADLGVDNSTVASQHIDFKDWAGGGTNSRIIFGANYSTDASDDAGLKFWAFISVTNNEIQHFTTIYPRLNVLHGFPSVIRVVRGRRSGTTRRHITA